MNTTLTADLDPRRQAMLLYFQGPRITLLKCWAKKLQPFTAGKTRQIRGDAYGPLDQMQLTAAHCQLIMKEQKEGRFQRD